MVSIRLPRPLEDVVQAWADNAAEIDGDPMNFSEAIRELLVLGLESRGFKSTVTDVDGTRVDEWKLS